MMMDMQIQNKTDGIALQSPTQPDEDARLMRLVATGDGDAMRQLMRLHMAPTVRLAFRMLGSHAMAEDVAQEAFVRVWKAAPTWLSPEQAGARFTTWLYRIVTNLAIDEKRKDRYTGMEPEELATIEDTRKGAEQHMMAAEQSIRVKAALAALPERQRTAFVMSFYDDRSDKDIAAILDITVKAVESLLVRARRGLRELLKSEEGGRP